MERTTKILFATIFALICGASNAQIQVQQVTADQAVQELVSGVQFSNAAFTGSSIQLGRLTGAEGTIFNPDSGIVIACADAQNLENGSGNDVPVGEAISGDQDLLDIANSVPPLIGQSFSVSAVNDIGALEFDFTPCGDSISFNYSFGSNEYLTYVNTSFNDIFAFFLSGPGIVGPYDAPPEYPDGAVNIAQVPESDPQLPITISSVNDQLNSQYYVNNQANIDIFCNGFTTVFTAEYPVISGETYHIKLAIADGSDDFLESYVVLESGSFSSNVEANVTILNPPPDFPPMTVLEGCVEAELAITRPSLETDTVFLEIGGTATNGVDYELLNDFVVFDQGEYVTTFDFQSLFDTDVEGTETLIINYTTIDECTGVVAETEIELFIQDYYPPELSLPATINLCNGESQTLNPTIENGTQPFIYEWSTGESTPTIVASSDTESPVNLMLTDFCETTVNAETDIILPPQFDIVDEVQLCLEESVSTVASGGAQPYSYSYSTDSIDYDGASFTPLFTGIYEIETTDECGLTGITILDVQVCEIAIPNIITPNGDQYNQAFFIQGNLDNKANTLRIFNRWGNVVYESDDYNNNWQAEGLPDGVYYYLFTTREGDEFTGTVTVLRE